MVERHKLPEQICSFNPVATENLITKNYVSSVEKCLGRARALGGTWRWAHLQLHSLKGSKSELFRSTEDRLLGKDVERFLLLQTLLYRTTNTWSTSVFDRDSSRRV